MLSRLRTAALRANRAAPVVAAARRAAAAARTASCAPSGALSLAARARAVASAAPMRSQPVRAMSTAAPQPPQQQPRAEEEHRESASEQQARADAAALPAPEAARIKSMWLAGLSAVAAGATGLALMYNSASSKCEEKKDAAAAAPQTAEEKAANDAVHSAAKQAAEAETRGSKAQSADFEDMRIFSGRANPALAQEIADNLGVDLGKISIKSYADGEIGIQVNENVRGKDVYLIQPTCPPGVNDNLVELILMISTMRRASARRITAVIPYYGYARQDRKMQARVPISAADVARLLQSMGVDRVVAVDLHCGQIQGFFGPRTPCDNLEGHVVALPYFQRLGLKGDTTVVVSPDAGGVHRAKLFRDGLKGRGVDAALAMIIKQRLRANEVGKMDLVGSVDGCDVIMVDDMIDTAGTLVAAARELKTHGAKRVFAFATHGVFSGEAYERIAKSDLERVVVCNTIPLKTGKPHDKIMQLSIGGVLSEAIARIHTKKSVSALFGGH